MNKTPLNPLHTLRSELIKIATEMSFSVFVGPEMESEYYNFDALNLPPNHPSRDLSDTFWIKGRDKTLMRTQTSPVQIRALEEKGVPCKIIVPGKVFRNEATDQTHEAQFYQLEGLHIDKNISLIDLKSTIHIFFKKLLGDNIKLRYRAGYFPFVEPGIEVDIEHEVDGQKKWLEILGAGMVHPKVLENVGINNREWSGYAFGFGIDRIAMIRYNISDIRHFYNSDLRFFYNFTNKDI